MTYAEAARILDPETTLEAYAECEFKYGFNVKAHWKEAVDEACRIAAKVLREKNAPVTIQQNGQNSSVVENHGVMNITMAGGNHNG